MIELLFGTSEKIEGQPRWLRPPLYGAAIIWVLIAARGGLIAIPLLLIASFVFSDNPWQIITQVIIIFGLATLGGLFAGGAYSLIGRRLHSIPRIGRYLAGVITAAPYCWTLMLILRYVAHEPLLDRVDGGDLGVVGFCSLFFGVILGITLFENQPSQDG